MTVRTRFAPSPTGSLHVGGARTAIFNWLFARHAGGEFILRIEDTDRERSTEESILEITDAMEWLGLDWDGEIHRQSERLEIYQKLANDLLESGHAYKCYVTPEELEEKRKEAQSKGDVLHYKREWAKLNEGPDEPYVIRLQTPDEGVIEVQDGLRGTVTFDATEVDDFIILKRDGFPTYNFAVVVDDATMNITHVIRGDDHLINTPRQVLIYNALNFDVPELAHVSMILGSDNKRLSKRHGATSVVAYKDKGYLPEAIINFLSRLGWSYGDQEIFSKEELIEKFTLDNVGKSAAVFNEEKLEWLNSWYIKNDPPEKIASLVIPLLKEKGLDIDLDEKLIKIIKELSQRAKTLLDIANSIDYFYIDPSAYDEKAAKKFLTPEILPVLEDIKNEFSSEFFDQDYSFHAQSAHVVFDKIMKKWDLKLGKLAQPMRVVLTGGSVSPGIFEVIEILGRETVLQRLNKAISYIQENK